MALERVVEPARALEARRFRNFRHGKVGVSEHCLREPQPARGEELHGRDAELVLEHAADMAIGVSEAGGQPLQAISCGAFLLDQCGCSSREAFAGIGVR